MKVFEPGTYKFTFPNGRSTEVTINNVENIIPVKGEWDVFFPKGWGAPEKTVFPKLISWTESTNPNIRYFSGTAEYRKTILIPESLLKGNKLYLDLGNVQEMADVFINDKSLGVLWMPPFIVDITEFAKIGENELAVQVVNLWPNRLIGDQFLPKEKRFTKTNIHKFKKSDELRVSGLIGPVRIIPAKLVPLH